MHILKRTAVLVSAFSLAMLMTSTAASASQAGPDPQKPPAQRPENPPAQKPATIEGELVRVDSDAKMLAVKIADGSEVEFKYSDQTEVTGAKDGTAGLATAKEARVRVTFTEDMKTKTKTATKIEVQPAKK